MSSVVVITVGGIDITDDVWLKSASFTYQQNAIPGTCQFTVEDRTRTRSFTVGAEIVVTVDGVATWGGYLMQIGRTHAFPADDTDPVSEYENRLWDLRGVDYNVVLDRRFIRDDSNPPASYLTMDGLTYPGTTQDGAVITNIIANHADMTGFTTAGTVDNTRQVNEWDTTKDWTAPPQGETLRVLFEELAKHRGNVYYIDAAKAIHFHDLDTQIHPWGFSDQPNGTTLIGFREAEVTEDGSPIVNDAMIWGGSVWAGAAGGTVFARAQDATSIATHGRWQVAERRFGEDGFGIQAGVDARANAIVSGPPGADAYGQTKGLRYSQWSVRLAWFAHTVPSANHLRPGKVVSIVMNTFGLNRSLPCRSITMTFPSGKVDGTTYVRFEGDFGIQLNDSFGLWDLILRREKGVDWPDAPAIVTNSTGVAPYGGYGRLTPQPAPNGSTTQFSLPFGYIPGTLLVFVNGRLQVPGTKVTETNPELGIFTLTNAPLSGRTLFATCRTLQGVNNFPP